MKERIFCRPGGLLILTAWLGFALAGLAQTPPCFIWHTWQDNVVKVKTAWRSRRRCAKREFRLICTFRSKGRTPLRLAPQSSILPDGIIGPRTCCSGSGRRDLRGSLEAFYLG